MSLKNSNDTIGNRTRDLPVCSEVLVYRVVVYNLILWLILRKRYAVNIRFIDSFHISYTPNQIFDTN